MLHNLPDPWSEYGNYTHMIRTDHFISTTSTFVDLVKEVSDLIPNSGTLSQVLGITGQLFTIINQIKTNKDNCMFLVERILRFLKDIAEECKQLDPPIRASSRAALWLYDLILWVLCFQQFSGLWCAMKLQKDQFYQERRGNLESRVTLGRAVASRHHQRCFIKAQDKFGGLLPLIYNMSSPPCVEISAH